MQTPVNAALDHVRRIADWARQRRDFGHDFVDAKSIGSVGIIGAGLMGTAIAATHVQYGLPVILYDADPKTLENAVAAIATALQTESPSSSSNNPRVRLATNIAELTDCDLMLESIVETLPAKRQLYAQLRGQFAPHTIVATNTSTIPIRQLAVEIDDPSRFCGMHFCHPVQERPLVEIIRGPKTSDTTIAAAVTHVQQIARIPIVVQDGAGFVVNRLLFPYLTEAMELLREGAAIEAIEQAAVEFGMAMGPLHLLDEIGLDTILHSGWVLASAFPERIGASPLLVSMVKKKRLGKKSGRGFFAYEESGSGMVSNPDNAAIEKLLDAWRHEVSPPDHETIAYRLVLPMLLEATRILEEGKVADPRDIDLAVLFGLGFPAEKGGLLWWADTLGVDRILAMLRSWSVMGERAVPTPMLQTLAKTGGRFYSADAV
jgi:3-hydroxyacyl-CoA dehydrogenase/enoyl-CoA hydratase/3-hydroxybutyryl-CoA epimerase/3-hydroxyacyl-CoA dehydrogenase/enoyl-CoA hydratase/3-hydroxybutyryl-CoA epimerase/enoyl-CoA isomerase